jgi:hypothetical protein
VGDSLIWVVDGAGLVVAVITLLVTVHYGREHNARLKMICAGLNRRNDPQR